MSDNPYQTPDLNNPAPVGADPMQMQSRVSTPAIALMVAGILNLLLALWGVATVAMIMAGVMPGIEEQRQQMEELQAEMGDNPGIEFAMAMQEFQQGAGGLVMNLLNLGLAVMVIVGALRMKNLRSYGLAMASSIVVIIPCVSCCLSGVPIGIWSLVVLLNADVKAAFRQNAG